MTKAREPLTFSLAISSIAELIGWKTAARVTRRAVRTVRHWSESDRRGLPTLDRAIALDRAFIAAGGGYAPILDSYARQLDVVVVDGAVCREAMAELVAIASRETGEAIALCIQALQPGASPAVVDRAIVETEEVAGIIPRMLGCLALLRRRNRAAREPMGENR